MLQALRAAAGLRTKPPVGCRPLFLDILNEQEIKDEERVLLIYLKSMSNDLLKESFNSKIKPAEMEGKEYLVRRIREDFRPGGESSPWRKLEVAEIRNYQWIEGIYRPRVQFRVGYSSDFLYISFKVWESKVSVRHTAIQSPVYKDSCVEFFIDPFPEKGLGYINVETNAIGAMLIGFGKDRNHRVPIEKKNLRGIEIVSSLKKPFSGCLSAEFWTLKYRLPQTIFEKCYGEKILPGRVGKGNFYKCGDETEFPHYGMWNPVKSAEPDFHRPEFFGRIKFV
jgi:hypothetical protein